MNYHWEWNQKLIHVFTKLDFVKAVWIKFYISIIAINNDISSTACILLNINKQFSNKKYLENITLEPILDKSKCRMHAKVISVIMSYYTEKPDKKEV